MSIYHPQEDLLNNDGQDHGEEFEDDISLVARDTFD